MTQIPRELLAAGSTCQGLDPLRPIALLPVRVETRFLQDGAGTWQLCVRIFPDDIHIDDHDPALSQAEIEARQRYDEAQNADAAGAWRELCHRVGPWRAAYAAKVTETTSTPFRPVARLLPERWVVTLTLGEDEQPQSYATNAVKRDLPVSPEFRETDRTVADMLANSEIAWLADLDKAVAAGMAIRIPAPLGTDKRPRPIHRLAVLGVPRDEDAVEPLKQLLLSHRYTGDLRLVPAGTPTNNTADAPSGWGSPDIEALRLAMDATDSSLGPDTTKLLSWLGLSGRPLRGIPGVECKDSAVAGDLIDALWPATWEPYLRRVLSWGSVGETDRETIRDHARWSLRPLGPAPVLCVGRQPYGWLPVTPLASVDKASRLERVLASLLPTWETAAKNVARLDPSVGDAATSGTGSEGLFAQVMAQQPWPVGVAVRGFVPTTPVALELPFRDVAVALTNLKDEAKKNGNPSLDWTATWTGGDLPTRMRAIGTLAVNVIQYREVNAASRTYATQLNAVILAINACAQKINEEYTGRTAFLSTLDPSTPTLADGGFDLANQHLDAAPTSWGGPIVGGDTSLLSKILQNATASASSHETEDAPLNPADLPDTLTSLPAAMLERHLLSILATADHRLDAWITSLASRRLSQLRTVAPTGLYVGAYAFVENLRPRADADGDGVTDGDGYILAPSLAHATTAAILRSGAHVYDDLDQGATFAVDLSSQRARTARELMAGVREGVPLSALLGRMVERLLHDSDNAHLIRPLRQAVRQAAGQKRFRGGVVDGVLLCRALLDGAPANVTDAARAVLGAAETKIKPALDALDATADAGLFEAVHALAAGRHEAASAMLGAMDRGSNPPPELHGLDTPRGGPTVLQRVILPIGPAPTRTPVGWTWVPRTALAALAEPRLEALLRAVLPRPDRVTVGVVWRDPDQTERLCPMPLAEVGLCALDLCRLASLAGGLNGSELGRILLATAAARRPFEVSDQAAPVRVEQAPSDDAHTVSLDEALAVAAALGRMSGSAQALVPEDLPRPGSGRVDHAALLTRLDHLAGVLVGAAAEAAKVARQELSDASDVSAIVSALRAAVGWDVPVLPPFVAPDDAWNMAFHAPVASGSSVRTWLAQAGRVRPGVDRVETVSRLVEALAGRPVFEVRGVQIEASEPWVAISAPPGPRETLVTLSLGAPSLHTDVAGLVLDTWTDRVPATHAHAGVAMHWNAPAARAPAAILLAVPPENAEWSLDLLQQCVDQAHTLARIRPVGPEHLSGVSQLLPALFLMDGVTVDGDPLTWDGTSYAASASADSERVGGGVAYTGPCRIELSTRAPDLRAGLRAEIADPAWMLARQHQIGEFAGEDASTPLRATGQIALAPVVRLGMSKAEEARWVDVSASGAPWEALVEGAPPADTARGALDAGLTLMQLLHDAGAGALWPVLRKREALRIRPGADAGPEIQLLARRSIDGRALRAALPSTSLASLAADAGLSVDVQSACTLVEGAWRAVVDRLYTRAPADAWRVDQLSYQASALALTAPGEALTLVGARYDGGRLDAHSFDLGGAASTPSGLATSSAPPKYFDVLPTPVRYAGQPNDRWWSFEDSRVDFGGIEAGVEDPARLFLAEFATVYGDDWYVLPVRLPFGGLARVHQLTVRDAFGLAVELPAIAVKDGSGRTFRLFELTGDRGPDQGQAPWMLLPHVLTDGQRGAPIEEVLLLKDELGNLGWAVERTVPGVDGRGRAHALPRSPDPAPIGDGVWRFRLYPPDPPRGWVPLVRVMRGEVEWLQRARLPTWDPARSDGPQSTLMQAGATLLIRDAELVTPLELTSAAQRARAPDGSVVLWTGRTRAIGRPQAGPGMQFDLLRRG